MAETRKPTRSQQTQGQHQKKEEKAPPSWVGFRGLFSSSSCSNPQQAQEGRRKFRRMGCSVSICNTRDASSKVTQDRPHPEASSHTPKDRKKLVPGPVGSSNAASRSRKIPLKEINGHVTLPPSLSPSHGTSSKKNRGNGSSSLSPSHATPTKTVVSLSSSSTCVGGTIRGMHLRRFSGCYECHSVVDPISVASRASSLRSSVCTCPDCGQIFIKPESLDLHQAVRHAVSELGPEDTSRNIVEIIFQSSWLKNQPPVCKIDRILKINNTQKTTNRFEDYRDMIKTKAKQLKRYPRCMADGNELLRFHSTTFTCSIGLKGSTNLCQSTRHCKICSIIRDGFKVDSLGRIRMMATSGRAHDTAQVPPDEEKRAMLVCRVIAGRIKRNQDTTEEHDSVAGPAGVYSNLDELFVFNPKAILPCFLLVYREV